MGMIERRFGKYLALRVVVFIGRIIGWLGLLVGMVAALGGLRYLYEGTTLGDQLTFDQGMRITTTGVATAFSALMIVVIAEAVMVVIDIERNTSHTAEFLRKLNSEMFNRQSPDGGGKSVA